MLAFDDDIILCITRPPFLSLLFKMMVCTNVCPCPWCKLLYSHLCQDGGSTKAKAVAHDNKLLEILTTSFLIVEVSFDTLLASAQLYSTRSQASSTWNFGVSSTVTPSCRPKYCSAAISSSLKSCLQSNIIACREYCKSTLPITIVFLCPFTVYLSIDSQSINSLSLSICMRPLLWSSQPCTINALISWRLTPLFFANCWSSFLCILVPVGGPLQLPQGTPRDASWIFQ